MRLIVLVVVDQMIPEQLERLELEFNGGFKRFAAGEVWHNAAHGHAATETGPGHATIGTGRHPDESGIVGNGWLQYDSGEIMYCVGDSTGQLLTSNGLGPEGSGPTPANLLVDGFAAHLAALDELSMSVGIAGKDRAAILSTGESADWALWWGRRGQGFTSSDAYGTTLPAWVAEWNEAWSRGELNLAWEARMIDFKATGTAEDARPGEPTGKAGVYPHVAPALSTPPTALELAALSQWIYGTPLMDSFAIEMGTRALLNMELGSDEHTDFLFIGLSACDVAGHSFGPYSREVTDILLSADERLGEFFDLLDERLGEEHWIAALSSDHGVLPLPESLPAQLVDGRRVDENALRKVSEALQQEVRDVMGGDFIRSLSGLDGWLDVDALEEADVDPEEVAQFAIEFLLQELPWLHRGITRGELLRAQEEPDPDDALLTLYARSFHPERSSDFTLVPKPWTLLSNSGIGTSHGSPWPYDRRVPLAFLGRGSRSRHRFDACLTVDILPTLLARAGIAVPAGLDGRVLE